MKRFFGVVLAAALVLGFAACGGDDDDDDTSSGGGGGDDTTEAAAEDFCTVWPEVNSDESTLDGDATEEQIAEARDAIARVEASAPDEIEDEVNQMTDALTRLIDTVEEGGDIDSEEVFGEVFALAFSVGPPIEAWLVENCPDYEPQDAFSDDSSSGDDTFFGVPQGDVDDIRFAAVTDDQGASTSSFSDEYEWTVYFAGDADAALAACEEIAEAMSSHPDASGTLKLTIATSDDTPLAVNAAITPGDAGSCSVA